MTGMLSILNVGAGDTKITFDKDKPAERERACRIVQDMLKRGYAILVQCGKKDGKPIFYRATEFDPKTAEYIVVGLPEDMVPDVSPDVEDGPAVAPPRKGWKKKRVPAAGARAVSVARSAGGMSQAANSIERENLRSFDAFSHLRGRIAELAQLRSEWAGVPMPLENERLVIEPHYPNADKLMSFGKEKETLDDSIKIRSRFFSHHMRCDVIICEVDGKIEHALQPAIHSLGVQMQTMGASEAWGIEQEATALQLLATLLPHHMFKRYLLTGMFIETSRRSGVLYVFRKLRPTVAISWRGDEPKIIGALCMHPIAYYDGSWAGAMAPTDDVIAHLMLMRGDEAMFWRRSNQHSAYRPEAGL